MDLKETNEKVFATYWVKIAQEDEKLTILKCDSLSVFKSTSLYSGKWPKIFFKVIKEFYENGSLDLKETNEKRFQEQKKLSFRSYL